ncbi:MAG: DUF4440 domain-containing protein [Acidimicrobiales bacterium]
MHGEAAQRIAAAWVEAWNSVDAEQVLALLHDDAVFCDPTEGVKVRGAHVADHIRRRMTERHEPVRTWVSLAGVDSAAVVCTMADGHQRADTLVVSADGRIVRVMVHT